MIDSYLEHAKVAKRSVQNLSDEQKVGFLMELSKRILAAKEEVMEANLQDLNKMPEADPRYDRLLLDESRIEAICQGVQEVARLEDPSGKVLYRNEKENGLVIEKRTVPLGVVGVVYESRPNVTVDVSALAFRSGNVALLRGGSDAFHTNKFFVDLIQELLVEQGLDPHAVQLLPTDREVVLELLHARGFVDVIIPRGSQSLIDFVRENATVPVIETGAGVCHLYVHHSADLDKALAIAVNSKVSRPSVCNALECLLIDQNVAEDFLSRLAPEFSKFNIEVFADSFAYGVLLNKDYPKLYQANLESFGKEYLALKCTVRVVAGLDEAMNHIDRYSSKHTDGILAQDQGVIELFMENVDSAAVYSNASTRFTDGGEFGLGAEIGISTQKLHARGPFALEKLITEKWFVQGDGQTR